MNVNSLNPLYLIINRIDGFIEEKNGDKYLDMLIQTEIVKFKKICRSLRWN